MSATTKSTQEVCRLLRLMAPRVGQWISREQFLPGIFPKVGFGRDWTMTDTLRLAVFAVLVDKLNFEASEAGRLTQSMLASDDIPEFFVAYRTTTWIWQDEIVPADKLGQFLTRGANYLKVLMAGDSPEVRRRNSEKHTGPVNVAAIIDLEPLKETIRNAFVDRERRHDGSRREQESQ